MIGVQPEKVYIEISYRKLATLGIDPTLIIKTLRDQNSMNPAGSIETASDQIYLRVSGDLKSVDAIREIGIEANGRQFRLGDIARVYRGYAEPAEPRFRYMGQDAIGLAVSMTKGGDILKLGEKLGAEIKRLAAHFPVGIDVHPVSDQPRVVHHSVNEFMRSLVEAVVIVLAVSFLSLGWRTGLVVALSIPLVLALTFLVMKVLGHRFAADFPGRLDHRPGAAGGRCHHFGGDDGSEDGAGLGPLQSGHLRLYLHGLSHADRHPGHGRRFHAGGLRQIIGRGILLFHFRRGGHRAAGLLARGGGVHALHRLSDSPGLQARARRG